MRVNEQYICCDFLFIGLGDTFGNFVISTCYEKWDGLLSLFSLDLKLHLFSEKSPSEKELHSDALGRSLMEKSSVYAASFIF